MSDTAVTAFLGDRKRPFDLAPHMLELERVTGTGIGALIARVLPGNFYAGDMPAIIRLGLIGGGETPKDAAALVDSYVVGRPLAETHQLAVSIALALWSGNRQPDPEQLPQLDEQTVTGEAA